MAYEKHNPYVVDVSPIPSGNLEITGIEKRYERHYISIEFFDNSDNLIDMANMAGTITFSVSDNGNQFGSIIVGQSEDGILTLGESTYPRPSVRSSLVTVRADLSGITNLAGATRVRMICNSHGN